MKALGLGAVVAGTASLPHQAFAATAQEINRDAEVALARLYNSQQSAQTLGREAKAILIFRAS